MIVLFLRTFKRSFKANIIYQVFFLKIHPSSKYLFFAFNSMKKTVNINVNKLNRCGTVKIETTIKKIIVILILIPFFYFFSSTSSLKTRKYIYINHHCVYNPFMNKRLTQLIPAQQNRINVFSIVFWFFFYTIIVFLNEMDH